MDIVFGSEAAFQLMADEKTCTFLEKNFSKCAMTPYVKTLSKCKKRDKEGLKSKKRKKQGLANIRQVSEELIYQWRLLILAIFTWLSEYGEPPLKDGEGWKTLNLIKVSKSEDPENLKSEEIESDESESEESDLDTWIQNVNNSVAAIRIRIASTLLYQFVEGRLTPEKILFVLKAKKTSKGIEFLFKMAKDTATRDAKILLRRIVL